MNPGRHRGCGSREILGEAGYPPGSRAADVDRGASPSDDLSPAQLWRLLTDEQQSTVYRDFFQSRWADLADCLDEFDSSARTNSRSDSPSRPHLPARPDLGKRPADRAAEALRTLWVNYRDAAVQRLAMAGQVRPHRY